MLLAKQRSRGPPVHMIAGRAGLQRRQLCAEARRGQADRGGVHSTSWSAPHSAAAWGAALWPHALVRPGGGIPRRAVWRPPLAQQLCAAPRGAAPCRGEAAAGPHAGDARAGGVPTGASQGLVLPALAWLEARSSHHGTPTQRANVVRTAWQARSHRWRQPPLRTRAPPPSAAGVYRRPAGGTPTVFLPSLLSSFRPSRRRQPT